MEIPRGLADTGRIDSLDKPFRLVPWRTFCRHLWSNGPRQLIRHSPRSSPGTTSRPAGGGEVITLLLPIAQCRDMNIGEEGVPTPWVAARVKEVHASHTDPDVFPFKEIYERQRHAVGVETPDAEISQRAVLDALIDSHPPNRAQLDQASVVEDEPGEYHARSSGVNRALGACSCSI